MIDPEVQARRDAAERAAKSLDELHELHERWQREDHVARAAETAQSRELADLRRRVRQLEANDEVSAEALGAVLGRHLKALREELRAEMLTYAGVHDADRSYPKNALTTHGGSLWLALAPAPAGERPGKAPCWRLISKAGSTSSGTSIA